MSEEFNEKKSSQEDSAGQAPQSGSAFEKPPYLQQEAGPAGDPSSSPFAPPSADGRFDSTDAAFGAGQTDTGTQNTALGGEPEASDAAARDAEAGTDAPQVPPVQNTPREEHTYRPDTPPAQPSYYNPQDPQYQTRSFQVNHGYQYGPPPQKDPKGSKRGLKVFAFLLALVVFTSLAGGFGYLIGRDTDSGAVLPNNTTKAGSTTPTSQHTGGVLDYNNADTPKDEDILPGADGKYTAAQAAKLVSPSVVGINVYNGTEDGYSVASGVILNKDGYVLTNDHIYAEIPNAKFVVTTSDGRCFKASYVAGDARNDLAVLKIENPENLTPAVFGDSDALASGDEVIAIGSPYGLNDTVTKGIVSAPSRRISKSSSDGTASYSMKVIQTDTALNPGNSGGALVNLYGQVIGISSSKIAMENYEGMCFAIPSNRAISVASQLTEYGKVVNRGRIGLTYREITATTAMMTGTRQGLEINTIEKACSLYNKGVAAGDIITKIDGKAITSSDDVLDLVESTKAGEKVELTIYLTLAQKEETFTVTLLEDASGSSYSTREVQQSTTSPFNFR